MKTSHLSAQDIKSSVPPLSFYQSRLPDLKSGTGWVDGGLCVFHADNHAGSFKVNVDTGAYKCFSCDAHGGDIIDFAKQHDNHPDITSTLKALSAEYSISGDTPFTDRPPPLKAKPKKKSTTGAYAKSLWLGGDPATVPEHPYAIHEGIDWHGGAARGIASGKLIGRNADCIIIPIRDLITSSVVAVQCVNSMRVKQTFGPLSGNAFICGNTLDKSIRWFVVEGWADAISMVFHHYDGNAVALAACGKSSMDSLAVRVAEVLTPDTLVIMEDAA